MWDAATADREFRRAIDLNPNNGIAHHWYATYLLCLRRYPESLAEMERARALDPSSSSVLADKGQVLFYAGRVPEAVALLKQLEENEPDSVSSHRYLKYIYLKRGEYREYLAESRKEADLMHDSAALAIADAAGNAFAADGGRAMLETLRSEQRKLYEKGAFSPYLLAETCSLMGNKAEALQYLMAAYDEHSDRVVEMETSPTFEGLRDELGFRRLLDKVGLPRLN
jgi:tetratricopeptide (TPR) repeat protein